MSLRSEGPTDPKAAEAAAGGSYVCDRCGAGFRLIWGASGAPLFCPYCGESAAAEEELPTDRRLCPDGDCIGILDDGGRCVICGRRGGD